MRRLARRHAGAGPRGRRRRRARAAVWAGRSRAGRGRRASRRRAHRVLRRQLALGDRSAARAGAPLPTTASATPAGGALRASPTAVTPTRRGSTGAMRWRIRARESRLACADRRQRRHLRRAPRGVPPRRPDHGPRPVVPLQPGQARGGELSTCHPRRRARRWSRPSRASGARKRRMMSHAWPIVVRGGLLSPRGYPPRYAFMIALPSAAALPDALPPPARAGRERRAAGPRMGLHRHLRDPIRGAGGGARRRAVPARVLLVARYYVLTTASPAAGLWDYLRHGTLVGWTPPEGMSADAPLGTMNIFSMCWGTKARCLE